MGKVLYTNKGVFARFRKIMEKQQQEKKEKKEQNSKIKTT